jgi:hypothetical protein
VVGCERDGEVFFRSFDDLGEGVRGCACSTFCVAGDVALVATREVLKQFKSQVTSKAVS